MRSPDLNYLVEYKTWIVNDPDPFNIDHLLHPYFHERPMLYKLGTFMGPQNLSRLQFSYFFPSRGR